LDQDASLLLDTLLQRESDHGRTILLITHDLSHGLEQSDRIAVLNRGRIATVQDSANITEAEFLELYAYHTRRRDQKRQAKANGAQK
jgi:ABC-type Mn2+/Zn2+ transport system ATPase subunit